MSVTVRNADWPHDDLPNNSGNTYTEFGVLLDRRDQGLGVVLLSTHSTDYEALDIAAKATGGKAHVRARIVSKTRWLAPVWDDRPEAEGLNARAESLPGGEQNTLAHRVARLGDDWEASYGRSVADCISDLRGLLGDGGER